MDGVSPLDKKAKRILFATHWRNGWIDRNFRSIEPADFEYAKAHGLMFDPVTWQHDETLAALKQLCTPAFAQTVASAFLASLSTRRLDWRSALGSWSMANAIVPHQFEAVVGLPSHSRGVPKCEPCRATGHYGVIASDIQNDMDLSVLSFMRLKWGGVEHNNLYYQRFDLEQLSRASVGQQPSAADRQILDGILEVIQAAPATTTAGTLVRMLEGVAPGTIAERRTLVEILGTAGILRYPEDERSEHLRSDWGPAGQWRGADGYDAERVEQLFGPHAASPDVS